MSLGIATEYFGEECKDKHSDVLSLLIGRVVVDGFLLKSLLQPCN
jgi:hypothetical protein